MTISVAIKPNSTKDPLIKVQPDGSLTAYVREIASGGQANIALIKLLSKHFDVPKTRIQILRGHNSRHKLIEVF